MWNPGKASTQTGACRGPRHYPGKRRRREQPAPSRDPGFGPFPCALRCFLCLPRRKGRGGKDPCGCPLPITNIVSCRWLPHFLISSHGISQRYGNASGESSPGRAHHVYPLTITPARIRMGNSALHCSPSPLTPVPTGTPQRKVKGGAGFARKGAELCWFLNVGLLCRDYAASPLPGPAWLLRVLSDFSPLCLSFPFPSFLHSLNPRQRRMSHAGMQRRPRVVAPLLSPRLNSHAAARL